MDTPSSRNNVEQVKPAETLLATPPHGFESITPQQIINNGKETEEKGKLTLKTKIIAGLAGLGIVGASAFGISLANSGEKGPAEQPVATAPGEASPTTAETEPDAMSFDNFEISASNTPEQVGTKLTSNIDAWMMYGSKDPDFDNKLLSAIAEGKAENAGDYGRQFAALSAPEIANEMFVKGWENNQELKKWVDLFENNHAIYIALRSKTTDTGNSKDIEPFTYSTKIESMTVDRTEDGLMVTTEAEEHANTNKNRSIELNPGVAEIDGRKFTMTALLVEEGDDYKIASLDIKGR